MATIRVDDDVWAWLKSHARPLEDTPNSVLRRIAGLDEAVPHDAVAQVTTGALREKGDRVETSNYRFTGEGLRREYDLPVRHCLYHKDGTFYEHLSSFPGALCDPRGYVQFDSEAEFQHDSRVNLGKKVNVPGGIASHPKYRRFPSRADVAR